jgi:hypothetical protein
MYDVGAAFGVESMTTSGRRQARPAPTTSTASSPEHAGIFALMA